MSEFQYYEFLAVDRPLTPEQMKELRAISTRAQITPTRMTNTYSYGDFRGDPIDLVTRHFDAHVYVANWGTKTLLLGFPRAAVDVAQLREHVAVAMSDYESGLSVYERGDRIIVDFTFASDEGGGWIDEDEAESWMPSLVQLRADILSGDLRSLYLGWLAGATVNMLEMAEMDEDQLDEEEAELLDRQEPPVPAGLSDLTAPLVSLTRFLDIDAGLVSVTADASAKLTTTEPDERAITEWIAQLPASEKDRLLQRVMAGDGTVGIELRTRLRTERAASAQEPIQQLPRRTVRELVVAGRDRAKELKRAQQAAERQKRQAYLDRLAGREGEIWMEIERLIDQRQARPYDDAIRLLGELAELADHKQTRAAFAERLAQLRLRHAAKTTFIKRLDKVGLFHTTPFIRRPGTEV
jgi:hypothetical protein